MPTVRTFTARGQTVIEVDADTAEVLDAAWRVEFAAAARAARAEYFGVGPGHCAARLLAERAGDLLALVDQLREEPARA